MSQHSQDLSGCEEVVLSSFESKTGISQDVNDMTIESGESGHVSSQLSSKSGSSGSSIRVVNIPESSKTRKAAMIAKEKMAGKRKYSSSSSSSSGSSYQVDKKSKKDTPSSSKVATLTTNGDVIMYGLLVTKKTGQVFYPQDSLFVLHEENDEYTAMKKHVAENKTKWESLGHRVEVVLHTFQGIIPTVIGGFTRGFMKSSYK